MTPTDVRDPNPPSGADDAFRALFDSRRRVDDERQLLADVVSAFQTGLYVYELEDLEDPAGTRILYANPATRIATGISPDAIVGRTLREAFPSTVASERPAVYAEVAHGGAARDLGDVVFNDGVTESVFSLRVFPLPGRRAGIAFNDVTSERKVHAQSLETLESMSDAFYTLDHDWRFTYLNPQSEPLLRRKREDLLGKNVWEEFPEALAAGFYTEYHRAVRDHVPVEFEIFYPPLDGWFTVRAHPTGNGLSVYYQDVTARRELESQLLQAQKLEAVGQLAGGVAHDFNNLLTVIEGYTALALSKLDADRPFLEKALGEIATASVRAAALTTKLLAFSRKQMLQSTVADANEIVSSALDLVEPLIGEQIQVHRTLDPDAGNVLVDVHQLEQVIVNLAVNGRDAMRNGGNLYVTTARVELDASAELGAGTYLCVMVRDDGCGMDADTQTKIFDPFFTTKPAGQGTGLGLSTAYGTITQSGGQLTVVSEPGEGTTFTIYLPRSELQVTPLPPTRTHPQPAGAGERILVVEDEDIVRRLVVEILESFDYEVVQARNPQEALVICAGSSFDLMVTDVVMPGGDGTSLARAAVTRQPNMRVLYTSGYTPQSIAHLELEGGKTAFLPKPFSAAQLAEQVRGLLDLQHDSG
ncbi:MAG TPA: ATP-binding protein [Gaiellaceae bacterium]|nr:ATP-binding protein [Gaiellaceae bacterium]